MADVGAGAFLDALVSYADYLQSQEWRATRKVALERAGNRCQVCGYRGRNLDVHHNTYDNIGNERPEEQIKTLGDEMLDDDDMFRVIKERAALVARREELIAQANACERRLNGMAWDLSTPNPGGGL